MRVSKARYAVLKDSKVYPLPQDYSFEHIERFDEETALDPGEVKLLAPVAPSKIVCVGTKLSRTRRRVRQQNAGRAAAVFEGAIGVDRFRR
jgi:hypothetical protein